MATRSWNPETSQHSPARVNPVVQHHLEQRISLDGEWRFRLDPRDEGVGLGWFNKPNSFRERIIVPGCWQGQGFGGDGEDQVWDFRLNARVFRATYHGTGWYAKRFRAPKEWRRRRVWLNFGGVHPSAEVWLNGERLGSHSAPFVPFAFDVTKIVSFGASNTLVIRVHEQNRWLGLAYNWQGHWSGLYRSVELTATGPRWLNQFRVHPDPQKERLWFRAQVGSIAAGAEKEGPPLTLEVAAGPLGCAPVSERTVTVARPGEVSFFLRMASPRPWRPDEPNLYRVDAVLSRGGVVCDALSERVGFVQLSAEGKQLLINGAPYYMRGSGDFAGNPETGCPDASRRRWRRKLSKLRDYGYNYVRCQSYVPTPEYYDAADEVGLLVQGEMGMLGAWAGQSIWHGYAWPQPSPEWYPALKWQWDRTVMRDVNHPSANIYCMSNELRRETMFPRVAWQCYHDTKAIKPSAMVIWSDGGCSPDLPGDFVNEDASLDKQCDLPLIQHEFRWWSSYPDVRLKRKYRGAVRPYAIELAEQAASKSGMSHLLPTIARNSQRLQYIEARTKLEICRRDNPTLAGICHFNAVDAGPSPQGVLNEFYGEKLCDAHTWRRSMGDTVVLISRDFDDRVLLGEGTMRCDFFVSDFSHPPLRRPTLQWELIGAGRRLDAGEIRFRHRPFRTCRAGALQVELPPVSEPLPVTLIATLREGDREFENHWSFWVFPRRARFPESVRVYGACRHTWLKASRQRRQFAAAAKSPAAPEVILCETLDETLVEYMKDGGRVFLAASEGLVRPFSPKLGLTVGRYFFLPPANYPPYEDGNSGTIVSPHPMLGDLPHEGFADLHFYRLIAESPPIDLKPLQPCDDAPVIRALSTYFVCHPLAYLVEFTVGKGGLIISSLDLNQKWPEAQYLLASILRYAAGSRFKPICELSELAIRHVVAAGKLP